MGKLRSVQLTLVTVVALLATTVTTAAATGPDSPPGPGVMIVSSCLGGNGRIDANIINLGPQAADYELRFGSLSPRVITVAPADWGRFSITGRPNADHRVVVRRDGALVHDAVVRVSCDGEFGESFASGPEVRIVNGCRSARGYLLIQLVNNSPTSRPYVITFNDGQIPNRSTTAAPFGAAVRAVTGRPDGVYPILIRSGAEVVYEGTVTVACNPPGADRADLAARLDALPAHLVDAPNYIDSAYGFGTELVGAWEQPRGSVVGLADGRMVSTSDSTYWVHDAADPRVRIERQLPAPSFDVVNMVALADGRIAGADFATVRIIDPDDPSSLTSLTTDAEIVDMDLLADGRLVAAGRDGTLRVWGDVAQPPVEIDLTDIVAQPTSVEIATLRDGRVLAYLGLSSPVMLVDPDVPGSVDIALEANAETIFGLGVTPSGLAVVATGRGIVVWDPAGPVSDGLVLPDSRAVSYRAVAGLADGSIAGLGNAGRIDIWEPPYDRSPRRIEGALGGDLVFLPGERLASVGYSSVQLWDLANQTGTRFAAHQGQVSAVTTLADGRIATGDPRGTVLVWDRAAMHSPAEIRTRPTANIFLPGVSSLAGLPDGRVAVAKLSEVRILDFDSPQDERYFPLDNAFRPTSMVAGPSGLVAAYDRTRLMVFDANADPESDPDGAVRVDETGTFTSVAALADGRFLFSEGTGAAIIDPVNGRVETVLGLIGVDVQRVDELSDGRFVAARRLRPQSVVIDPSRVEEAFPIEGRYIGQRDDGRLVLERSGTPTSKIVTVDLLAPANVRSQTANPNDVFYKEVSGNSVLGAYGTGWVLFR